MNEARAREVTLREVAENAVFEAESEVERHRVLYHRERKARMKMQRRLTFYRQLEERLKEVAPGNMKDRLSFLFEEKKSPSIKSSKRSNQSNLQSDLHSNLQSSQQSSQHSSSSPSKRRARSRSGSSNNYRDEYYPDSAPSINFNIRNSNDAQSSSTPLGTFMNGSKKGTTMQSLRTMSVSELRYFLNLRNIPHRDCIEKIELLFRAQTALEKEEKEEKQEKQEKQERKEFNSEMKGEKMDDENESSNDMGSNDGSNGSNDSSGEGDLGGVERRDRVESERASWETSSEEEEDEYKKEEKEQEQETTKDQKKEEAEEKENEDEDEDGLVFRLSRRTKKKTTNINDNNDINNADLNFFKTKINNTTTNQNGSSSTTTTTTTTSSSTASASDRRKKQSVLRAKRRAAASKKSSSSSRRSRNHRSTRTQSPSNTTAPTTTNTNTTNTASSITTTSIPTSPNDDPPLVGIHTLPSPEIYTTTTTTNNQYLPSPSPPPPPSFNSTDVTNQRIEERRLREELDAQQREIKAVQKLRSSEQQKQQEANEITSVQGRLRSEVQQWAINKSLIRMLCTLDKIMGTDITLPTLKLRLSSTSSDVKTAYKQALRCVHPDKLRSATTNDRVRGEYVFNALREAYTRSNENGGMFGPTPVWAKRW